MTSSVGTKVRKKQSPKHESKHVELPRPLLVSQKDMPAFERALMNLDSVCQRILDDQSMSMDADADRLCWQHRFKNIVTPVSLAMTEYKGPRRFHYHYRHRADDASILHPVLEDPVTLMAQVCDHALGQCQSKLVGIRDRDLIKKQQLLESALRTVLMRYNSFSD